MYIEESEIKGTKFLVQKRDVLAVQKVLFKSGYGYELNLDKSFILRKYKTAVCFYVDYNGFITVMEQTKENENEFWNTFHGSSYTDLNWECLF